MSDKTKKKSVTSFKASTFEVMETALLGSALYLLAVWIGSGFHLDTRFLLKATYNALAVGACWMIGDDWSCKWNNARDLCIWQEYVGLMFYYAAAVGWAMMVNTPDSPVFFFVGVVLLATGAVTGTLWYYYPYTHAVLESNPKALVEYEAQRYAARIERAKTKEKLQRLFSKVVRFRYVADTYSEGPCLDKPLDDQLRSLAELRVALVLARIRAVLARSQEALSAVEMLRMEIDMAGKYVAALADKQLAENGLNKEIK